MAISAGCAHHWSVRRGCRAERCARRSTCDVHRRWCPRRPVRLRALLRQVCPEVVSNRADRLYDAAAFRRIIRSRNGDALGQDVGGDRRQSVGSGGAVSLPYCDTPTYDRIPAYVPAR